ncbi:MAG: sulfatase-like hydrolase/transferase [Sphaerochaetaceae bacterium]|nr:sulfatase-like hydrolase/transferase [Sphaerochaetaceae bacterium]
MEDKILLISKDATIPSYFEPYGGSYWKTPNISELAAKGTVFNKHYTVAPSTAMAFIGMFTGKLPLETEHIEYVEVAEKCEDTLFDRLYDKGYECHLMWSANYVYMAEKYSKCYGQHTIHHENLKLNQSVGQHKTLTTEDIAEDEKLAENTLASILNEIKTINMEHKVFLWLHVPHVLLGRGGYGRDMDLFDKLIGELRKIFPDEGIYITADHGHMNMTKGKTCYGFDVYQSAIRIPLITPRINGMETVDFPTSNCQLMDMILNETVTPEEFIVSDSAYCAQPYRKVSVIRGKYKYIYNKSSKKEELYDVEWDPEENNNLLEKYIYDTDRHKKVIKEQVYFYPYMAEAETTCGILRDYFHKIWRTGTPYREMRNKLAMPYRRVRTVFRDIKKELKEIMRKK